MKTNTKKLPKTGFVSKQLTFGAAALTLLGVLASGCTDEENMDTTRVETSRSALGAPADGRRDSRRHDGRRGHEGYRDGRGRPDKGDRAKGHHPMRRHGAGGGLFEAALSEGSLTDGQRSRIEALVEKGRPERKGKRFARKDGLGTTLAQAMRAGALDDSTVTAYFEQIAQVREAKMAARLESLSALHDALEPAQRRAVVDAVKARAVKRDSTADDDTGRYGRKDGRHGEKHGKRDGRGFIKGGDRVLKLADGLDLSEDQKQAIGALREETLAAKPSPAEREARRAEMKTCRSQFLESFASESFDATTGRCKKRDDETRQARTSRYTKTVNALIAILTDAQRAALADKLERAPERRPRRS